MRLIMGISVVLALLIGFAGGTYVQERNFKQERETLAWYSKQFLQKQGGGDLFGVKSYDLRSIDGGRNWFAVERTNDEGIKVLGPVEKIYPGLMGKIYGLNALTDYAKKNGPVTFSDERKSVEKKLLEAAGFTVVEDKGGK